MMRRRYSSLIRAGLIAAITFTVFARGGHQRLYWLPAGTLILSLTAYWFIFLGRYRVRFKLNPSSDLPLLLFLAWAGISFFTSVDREQTLFELTRLFSLVMIYFLTAYALPLEKAKIGFLVAIIAIGLIEASFGLAVYFSGRQWPIHDLLGIPFEEDFITGTFRNRNHFAGLMEMCALMGLGMIRAIPRSYSQPSRQAAQRILLVYASASIVLALVFSLSRGGWMALLAGFALFVALSLANRNQRWSRVTAFAVLMAALVGAFIWVMEPRPVYERLQLLERYYRGHDNIAAVPRASIMKSSLAMVADQPLTGSGWGTFKSTYPAYRRDRVFYGAAFAHNDYLQIAAGMGLPGLFLFILFVSSVFKKGLRLTARGDDLLARAMPGILAAMFAILVHGLVDFNLMIPSNAMIFLALAGMVAGHGADPGIRPRKESRVFLTALLLLPLLFLVERNARAFWAEVQYQRGEAEKEAGEMERALSRFERAAAIFPERAEYHRALGKTSMRLYNPGSDNLRPLFRALSSYQQALELNSIYPYHWFEMGLLLDAFQMAGSMDQPPPEPYYRRSLDIDSENPLFLVGLLDRELRTGKREEAWNTFARLVDSRPRWVVPFGDRVLESDDDLERFGIEMEGHPEAVCKYASYLLDRGQPETAIALLMRLPERELYKPGPILLLAEILEFQGRPQQAREIMERAIAVADDSFPIAVRLGQLFERQKDPAAAISIYMKALDKNPEQRVLHLWVANLARDTGDQELALEHYELALGSDRLSSLARKKIYTNMASMETERGELKKARSHYGEALALDPDDREIEHSIDRLNLMIKLAPDGKGGR